MIRLRNLDEKDAPLMLEWMHDTDTISAFKRNMLDSKLEDVIEFCKASSGQEAIIDGNSLHYAIVDETDEYMGTISLKNINFTDNNAEYAIVLRRKYRGLGIAEEATRQLLEKAFGELRLHRVFLTVLANNDKAQRLYQKCGFVYEGCLREHICLDGKYYDWHIYGIVVNDN